jgi:hypothetical protein
MRIGIILMHIRIWIRIRLILDRHQHGNSDLDWHQNDANPQQWISCGPDATLLINVDPDL